MTSRTWPMDTRRIGVRCSACDRHGSVMVDTDGDISVDVELGIIDAWCSEHLPPALRAKGRKLRAHVCNATCPKTEAPTP
jgi:hypothetical protein